MHSHHLLFPANTAVIHFPYLARGLANRFNCVSSVSPAKKVITVGPMEQAARTG